VITLPLPPDLPVMVYTAPSWSPQTPADPADSQAFFPLALGSVDGIPFEATIDQSGILFIGLNGNASAEAHALESVGLPLQRILYQDSPRVTLGDRSFDLTIEADVWDFIQSLGFRGAQAIALVDTLWGLDFAIRDEVGRIIQVWSMAELHDGKIPSRLVLSGHSGGRFFWGLGNTPQAFSGNLELRDLRRIAALMPKAVDRVRSVFLAGCNTGWEENLREMAALFPKAQSLTGYTYSAPLASEEAPAEILHWAQWTFLDEESLRPFAPNMAVFHPASEFYQQQKAAGERPETLVALDEDPEWREAKRNQRFTDDLSDIQDPYQAEVLRGVLETSLRLLEGMLADPVHLASHSSGANPDQRFSQLQAGILEVLAAPNLPDRYHHQLETLHTQLERLEHWSEHMAALDREFAAQGVQLEVDLRDLNYLEFHQFVDSLSPHSDRELPWAIRSRLREFLL
jgi:hypothetical protein